MKWNIKQRKRNYDGHFKVDQLIVQHELFAGGMSKELTREQSFQAKCCSGATL